MDPFQIIKVRLENLTIIVVYRSPQIESHTLLLESLIQLVPQTCPAVICGDFNTDPKKALEPYHKLTSTLATQGFNQIVDTATHLKGGILDHFYVRNTKIIDWHLHQVGVLQRISLSASKYSVSCQNPSCKYCSLKGGATWVVNWYNLSESLVDNKTTSSAFNEVFEIPL